MTFDVAERPRLEGISPRAYEHPADRAATAALASIPYLDPIVRKLIELGYERALRTALLGDSVRLGQDQLPRVWALHHEAFHVLDVEPLPALYLTQFPFANAAAIGAGTPLVLLNSEIVTLLDEPACGPCSRTRPGTSSPTMSSTGPRCSSCSAPRRCAARWSPCRSRPCGSRSANGSAPPS